MKQLLRRLSRVSDSSSPKYSLLRQQQQQQQQQELTISHRTAAKLRRSLTRITGTDNIVHVPHGHVPVYVGDEMERFIVNAKLLNHPIFIKLLNISAQEYGYEQQGALRVPCRVFEFEMILEAIRLNLALDLQDFIDYSLSDEMFS